ncbi:histidine phosphatase family protein [Paenibacillus sp. GYB004]|uniref:histidine phosphatase family protein n=1 Tax=Paenibacillus sp. GYB004 TaxID=2994393 RepID=UPI002F965502
MTTFGFIRHGTTDWNMEGRLQGQNNIPLNEAGRFQALLLGERLRDERWDLIVSSDLLRASETAGIIAAMTGAGPVRLEARLRERTHGRLDGTTLEERIACWGEGWKQLDHGVESNEALFARGSACLAELESEYAGKRILIVSHGAFIAVLIEGLLKHMPEGSLRNTSISVLEKAESSWTCPLFNSTTHLPQ